MLVNTGHVIAEGLELGLNCAPKLCLTFKIPQSVSISVRNYKSAIILLRLQLPMTQYDSAL